MQTLLPSSITYYSQTHVIRARTGIQLSFTLLEPVVFLQAPSTCNDACMTKATVLRGSLHVTITEATKIKRICVYLRGVIKLELSTVPADIAPKRDLITCAVTCFDKRNTVRSGNIHGAALCHIPDQSSTAAERSQDGAKSPQMFGREQSLPPYYHIGSLQQLDRLEPIPILAPRISSSGQAQCQLDLFPAGDYMYSFEFLMHDVLPETLHTDLVSTRYYLEAVIEPSGPFCSKIIAQLDVPVIRLPAENSLELTESIFWCRSWRDKIYYDICILGKCFPLGSRIPVRLKLTPLADLECNWIRVYVSEHVQHRTKGRETHCLQLPPKKVLLFQKQAGHTSYSTYPGSTMRIMAGKSKMSSASIQAGNFLGEVSETLEIELEVQLPRCTEMMKKDKRQWLHFSTRGSSEVNHWIQIVLCLKDTDRPTSGRSEPMELIMENPLTILSCMATPENIYVPRYEVKHDTRGLTEGRQCGCGEGGVRLTSLSSRHESEAPETDSVDAFTSVGEEQFSAQIVHPLNFSGGSTSIKLPPQAHLPG